MSTTTESVIVITHLLLVSNSVCPSRSPPSWCPCPCPLGVPAGMSWRDCHQIGKMTPSWYSYLIVNGSGIQSHQLLSRQLLDYGSSVAVTQHIIGGANPIPARRWIFDKAFSQWNCHYKLDPYSHKPVHGEEQRDILNRRINGGQHHEKEYQGSTRNAGRAHGGSRGGQKDRKELSKSQNHAAHLGNEYRCHCDI